MFGAIIGDVVGSRFEWNNNRSKEFDLFTNQCTMTDDSIMSIAVAYALMRNEDPKKLWIDAQHYMRAFGQLYPNAGYGGMFREWLKTNNPQPYNSWGNGSAMRISSVGWVARSEAEAINLSTMVTSVTHNHPEGLKGAESVARAIYLLRNGMSKNELQTFIQDNYYDLNFTLDGIRDSYEFNESCQNTVPQAFRAVIESDGFEDCIRNAISIGGDSDTLAAIAGSIAEALYGIPDDIENQARNFIPEQLWEIVNMFRMTYCVK